LATAPTCARRGRFIDAAASLVRRCVERRAFAP
jgi:hypothetical protein